MSDCDDGPGYRLDRLLRPRSVAVVGATSRHGSYGAQALISLEAIGYPGKVWGVNPNRDEALGRPCVPSIADLPEPADAVVVAIPAAAVPDAIEQAGVRGCGGAVVFSAGFAEVADGVALQARLVRASRRHRLPVCGPNCNGIVAMHSRTALWGDAFAPADPGAVALISQSGNVAVNALGTRRGLRFHTVVASGNQAVLSAADYLELLAGEDGLRSVALYLEDDGGPRLCQGLAACADAGVSVVVLKVGSSPAGARAAAAHSAALAGDQRIFRSLVQEAGGVWAADVHELLELAKTLAVPRSTRPSRGLAIVTCSGGDSAQGADAAAEAGLGLPAFSDQTAARLSELLPSAATVANPLDYTAMIWGDKRALGELVTAVGSDPSIGQVLVFYDTPTGMAGAVDESWAAVRDGIIAGSAASPAATLVAATLPELLDDAAAWRFAQAGVPAAAGLRTGIACAAAIAAAMRRPPGDSARLREIAQVAGRAASWTEGDPVWLSEHESKQLLRASGVAVVEGRVVVDPDDAVAALTELGGPIALKLSSPAVQHKSELGGVALGLADSLAVREAFARIAAVAADHGGEVLAERMADPGVELLIGARTDAIVPALVLGLGGIWTELLDDVAIVPLPADAARIERALRSLRGAPVLEGGRGREMCDVGAAARLAERVGELLLGRSLGLVELNPVLVSGAGAVVADAAICTRSPSAAVGAEVGQGGTGVYDVVVIGGGFAGITAAREAALQGRSVVLLEARDRLGGRTWRSDWGPVPVEYGGAWVHWHQPHTFSELTRAGLPVLLSDDAEVAAWYVGDERRRATISERDEIARRGWDRFVDGVRTALPKPHDPLFAIDELARFDRLSIAQRLDELELSAEERDVLTAELESLAHAPLADAGAVSVLRWHALSGYSLELTQFTGGRVTIAGGTRALLEAIAAGAPFERRLGAPATEVARHNGRVEVQTADGGGLTARAAVVAVPINALSAITFSPGLSGEKLEAIALGQASRGIKIFIHARGEPVWQNAIRPGHPFGYLDTEQLFDDGTQLMIGFGIDAERCDATNLPAVQRQLDEIMPGYEVLDATAHDWLADERSRGTWAIHRPGWYEHHHAAMRSAEGRVVLAGSDIADGWSGFIDGAIESGLRAGTRAAALASR